MNYRKLHVRDTSIQDDSLEKYQQRLFNIQTQIFELGSEMLQNKEYHSKYIDTVLEFATINERLKKISVNLSNK